MNAETEADTVLPCADKLAFDTKREATAAATVAQHRYGTVVRPYVCRYCQLWHLASHYE